MGEESKEEKIRKKIKQLRSELPEPQRCSFCPGSLGITGDEEPYEIDGKPACEDCYMEKLGDALEKSPPGYLPKRIKVF
jgi:hypothetical protein